MKGLCFLRGTKGKKDRSSMELKKLNKDFSVCKIEDYSQVHWNSEYLFIEKTDEENSLVCLTEEVPSNTTAREDGWTGFRIQGVLDFSLIGILADITTILKRDKIPVFVVSTYNTDYVLLKKTLLSKATATLEKSGYRFVD